MSWGGGGERERERADTDLELSSVCPLVDLTCFLAASVLTAVYPSSNCYLYRHIHLLTLVITSSCLTINLLFSVTYPTSTAFWHFYLSSFKPIKSCCQFAIDTCLFLTQTFQIILHVLHKNTKLVAMHRLINTFSTITVIKMASVMFRMKP